MIDPVTVAVVIAATATSAGSAVAAWYYVARMGVERHRSSRTDLYYAERIAIEKRRTAELKAYYDEMLALEREKVAVERAKLEQRRNG